MPVSGFSSPAMTRSSVDLPPPLGPSSAVSEPSGISTETSSRATKSPNCLVTLSALIAISASWRGLNMVMRSTVESAIRASTTEAA